MMSSHRQTVTSPSPVIPAPRRLGALRLEIAGTHVGASRPLGDLETRDVTPASRGRSEAICGVSI